MALNDRIVDVLSGGETYTIEREVNEVTGASFTFSAPYYYDGMAFAGNETFVTCAEENKRYDECSQMVICVTGTTTDYFYVASHYTIEFFVVTSSLEQSIQLYFNGTCNTVASSRLDLLNHKQNHLASSVFFVIGNNTYNNDPLSFVTRENDYEWSSVINWVLQALFFGERTGVIKNESLCEIDSKLSTVGSKLSFLNAVHCGAYLQFSSLCILSHLKYTLDLIIILSAASVGNYGQIYGSSQLAEYARTEINTINKGSPMLYVIPFGNLDNSNDKLFSEMSQTFDRIDNDNQLSCGLLIDDGYNYNEGLSASNGLFGMGVSYCQTLASSMLDGNLYGVKYSTFQDAQTSIASLNNQSIDVLLGLTADMNRNFGPDGAVFSTPYYYGNQTGG